MGAFAAGLAKKVGQKALADHGLGKGKKKGGTGPSTDKAMDTLNSIKADPDSFKRGGLVKRTGMAKVHAGERVLTKRQQKSYRGKSRSK